MNIKKTTFMARQGDVLIIKMEGRMPESAQPVKRDRRRVVLAYGEVTGHAHAIHNRNATLYREPKAEKPRTFLRVIQTPVSLLHEEHQEVKLPPGLYEIQHQREYHPEEIRRVAD